MTTITFEFVEDIKIKDRNKKITIWDFFDILRENEIIPELKELEYSEITPGILEAYNKAINSPKSSFINI